MCGDAEEMFRPLFKPWTPWEEIPSDEEDEEDSMIKETYLLEEADDEADAQLVESDTETVDGMDGKRLDDPCMDETQLCDILPAASATPEDVPLSIFCM